jgi:hypothetical protein
MQVRKWVEDQLTPHLPDTWRFIRYDTNVDRISQTIVMLKLQSIARTPSAPNSGHTVEFVLTVVEPRIDPKLREDDLDEKLIEIVYAIDTVPNIRWTNAQRVLFNDTNLAFDITLEVVTSKDKEAA